MIGETLDRCTAVFDRRFVSRPGWVVLGEVFLGLGWLRAVGAKAVDADWWNGAVLRDFVAEHDDRAMWWYEPIVEHVVLPADQLWSVVVILLELAIGLALLTAWRLTPGLWAGLFLSLNFLLAGSPNPSVFYLVLTFALLLWRLESVAASAIGLRTLRVLVGAFATLAVLGVLQIRSLDPATVIDDAATVLVVWSICAGLAAAATRRRVRRTFLANCVIDLRQSVSAPGPR